MFVTGTPVCVIFQAKELLTFFLKEIVAKVGFHVPYFVHKITFVLAYNKATIYILLANVSASLGLPIVPVT